MPSRRPRRRLAWLLDDSEDIEESVAGERERPPDGLDRDDDEMDDAEEVP
jgi:hypothetical protein